MRFAPLVLGVVLVACAAPAPTVADAPEPASESPLWLAYTDSLRGPDLPQFPTWLLPDSVRVLRFDSLRTWGNRLVLPRPYDSLRVDGSFTLRGLQPAPPALRLSPRCDHATMPIYPPPDSLNPIQMPNVEGSGPGPVPMPNLCGPPAR